MKQAINLQLDCHRVRLQVERDKEAVYRRAGVRLNEVFKKYQRAYPHLSVEQVWVYTALEMAVGYEDDTREKNIGAVKERVERLVEKMKGES